MSNSLLIKILRVFLVVSLGGWLWTSCMLTGAKRKIYEQELQILQLQAEKKSITLAQKKLCIMQKLKSTPLPSPTAAKEAEKKIKKLMEEIKKAKKLAPSKKKKTLKEILKEIQKLEKEAK